MTTIAPQPQRRRRHSALLLSSVLVAPLCFANYFGLYQTFSSIKLTPPLQDEIIAPQESRPRHYGNATAQHFYGTERERQNLNDASTFRQLNVTEFPYKCGLILFYHIPCTGGASINRWFKNKISSANNMEYFTFWGRNRTARASFARKMNEQLQNSFGPSEWRLAQAHGCSLLPIQDEDNLRQWRQAVESQGCRFILTTVVRDALSHSISQLKERDYAEMKALKNAGEPMGFTMEGWVSYLGMTNRSAPRIWSSQLDYFLFNCWDKNKELNDTMTKEEKVQKAVRILRNHYDLVVYQNHDLFVEMITKMVGFEPIPLRSSNQHKLEINFTSPELGLLKRKIHENGDVDFINAIRHIYHSHLSYLA